MLLAKARLKHLQNIHTIKWYNDNVNKIQYIRDKEKNTSAKGVQNATIPPQYTTVPPPNTSVPPQHVSISLHPTAIIYWDALTCSGGLHQIHGCISWCSEDTYVVFFPLQ